MLIKQCLLSILYMEFYVRFPVKMQVFAPNTGTLLSSAAPRLLGLSCDLALPPLTFQVFSVPVFHPKFHLLKRYPSCKTRGVLHGLPPGPALLQN